MWGQPPRRQRWELARGLGSIWARAHPRRGLGGLATGGRGAVSRGAGEQGGRGQPGWGGGSVHTRLGWGNYNPTVAPAYRATSDPSKRVAWEFGWRQRPAGEARSAATTATAPPLPQSGRRSCAVGERGWTEPGEATAGLVPHPSSPPGLSLRPRELNGGQQSRTRALLHRTHSGGSTLGLHNLQPSSSV